MAFQNPRLAAPAQADCDGFSKYFCLQDKLDKENVVKKEGPDTRVEKDATSDDLFSAHNFDITIDLGKSEESGDIT